MPKLTVRDIDVSGKKVLVRVDFNVPLDKKTGAITDDNRIRATLPTIKYLISQRAKIILASHLGRPDGKVVDSLRLTNVAQRLSQILGQQVGVTKDCIGPEARRSAENLQSGHVLLLENLRFHAEEETNSLSFAQALAALGEIFVNDAFGACHRNHASIVGITRYLPSVAGLLLEKELENLSHILENPSHPFGGLVGGAKVSDKVGMLENIMSKVDCLLIGGGMAATFLKAKSYQVGLSLVEVDRIVTATKLMEKAAKNGVNLILPVDVVVTDEISSEAKGKVVPIKGISSKQRIVDIGPQTIKDFNEELRKCRTIFWNGPMGVYEIPQFAEGTMAMAKLLAGLKAKTIIGGGSTAELVIGMGLADKMTFVSTGGGSTLSYLGGQKLPGVEALLDKNSPAAAKLKPKSNR
ncbi:MAG: phosphoglycerate kinase [Dehalococcoidales bacterium]|nr:phosphoglycerate kinase [Dehalococcoidales bacterium]